MCREEQNRMMVRMIDERVRTAKAMLGEEEEKKPFVSIEQFIEQSKMKVPTA